jgi:hypothetical protein
MVTVVAPNAAVSVSAYSGGTYNAANKTATPGTTVQVAVTPDAGYLLGGFTCDTVELTYVMDPTRRFIMPAADVTVNVETSEVSSYTPLATGGITNVFLTADRLTIYEVHKFNYNIGVANNYSLVFPAGSAPVNANVLVVAGGGGGGGGGVGDAGGGGGAGGNGCHAPGAQGSNGADSVFGSLVAKGGGGGGSTAGDLNGLAGGSSGGGGSGWGGNIGTSPNGVSQQGNKGGNGSPATNIDCGGGGGGAGGVGQNASGSQRGQGGAPRGFNLPYYGNTNVARGGIGGAYVAGGVTPDNAATLPAEDGGGGGGGTATNTNTFSMFSAGAAGKAGVVYVWWVYVAP